jgi:hypothetical protein
MRWPARISLALIDLSHLAFSIGFLEELIMKSGSLLALLNLATVSTALTQNASFITGEIAQISACGVR